MKTITRLASLLVLLGACNDAGNGTGDGNGGDGGTGEPDACVGLQCDQVKCEGGAKTTVTGTVYTPAGNLPLYNVTVYVPNSDLTALPTGVSCDRCGDLLSGSPVVRTTTDTHGKFVLENVPVGEAVPLVIQTGKWRKTIKLPKVEKCVENAITDASLTRLPKNRTEGDMPQLALTTGDADALECLLLKIGIDKAEITDSTGTGKVHLFYGEGGTNKFNGGKTFTDAGTALWNTKANLSKYDAIFLSCEGAQNFGNGSNNKNAAAATAMKDYTAVGGRVFATHWHNTWIEDGPAEWQTLAKVHSPPDDLPDLANNATDLPVDIDQGTDAGQKLAEWLLNVQASTVLGKVPLHAVQHSIESVVASVTRFLFLTTTANDLPSVQTFSFNTPVGAVPGEQCGKFVFTDVHVSSGDSSVATDLVDNTPAGTPYPLGCTSTDLTPQEKLLIYMLFDVTSCIAPPVE